MEYIKQHRGTVITFFLIIIIALVLPLTLFLVFQQQNTKSKATGAPIALMTSPAIGTYTLNSSFDVAIKLNTSSNNVSGIDLKIEYDPIHFNLVSFTPANMLPEVINDTSITGVVRYVGANQSASKVVTGSAIDVGTLRLTAKALGTGTVGFSNIQAVAQGGGGSILPINTTGIVTGTYTITNVTAESSPTTGVTLAPTVITAAPTAVATLTPTHTVLTPTTVIPTPTLQPGTTSLSVSYTLPGIGNLPSLNSSPLRQTRSGELSVYDLGLNLKNTYPVNTIYNPQTAIYTGMVNLGSLPTGDYIVKFRLDNTLYKASNGALRITGGGGNLYGQPTLLTLGDLVRSTSSNNSVDLEDYNAFLACIQSSGPGSQNCELQIGTKADFNDDGKIDSKDLNILLRAFANHQGD